MAPAPVPGPVFRHSLAAGWAAEEYAGSDTGPVVVDGDDLPDTLEAAAADTFLTLPAVVVAVVSRPDRRPAWADLVLGVDDPDLDAVVATSTANPLAATTLAVLLRSAGRRSVAEGLVAESTAYGLLQGGPEFARWRRGRSRRERPDGAGPPVRVDRDGDTLSITLDRPHVRNALSSAVRDGLVAAVEIAVADPSVATVHLAGAGPSFCSGGDLDEFGSCTDPASAHLLRLLRSPARSLARVADRTVAHLHGDAVGSGIELAAFAARVEADPSTRIALPEVGLGLIPGAGGTVSLPARIGRHRTLRLALTGRTLDAAGALAWGLVDALVERPADCQPADGVGNVDRT
jgi:enoyl-CoA hydratase/carnithine racemase